jgi:uncharacterized protein
MNTIKTGIDLDLKIEIEIAYASEEKQHLISLKIPKGSSVKDAIEQSDILKLANIKDDMKNLSYLSIGIWSKPVNLDYVLEDDGVRVEIYRGLKCDPKEVRRARG